MKLVKIPPLWNYMATLFPAKKTKCDNEQVQTTLVYPAHPRAQKYPLDYSLYGLNIKTVLVFKNGGDLC